MSVQTRSQEDLQDGDNEEGLYDLAEGEADPTVGMDLFQEEENRETQTVLNSRFCFWYMRRGVGPKTNYEDNIHKIASFQTVEYFWRVYDHLLKPDTIKQTIDYHLFKDGIKPTWEHPANLRGGKWMIRLRKGLGSRYWEELVLGIIGEQFDVGNEICGAVISIRAQEDILSVWNRNAENQEAIEKIREQLRRILKLPYHVTPEYKKHSDSITDKSSFRGPEKHTFRTRWNGPQGGKPVKADGTDEGASNLPAAPSRDPPTYAHVSSSERDRERERDRGGRHSRNVSVPTGTAVRPHVNGKKDEGEDVPLEWNRRGKADDQGHTVTDERRGFKRFQDNGTSGPGAPSNWERPQARRYQHTNTHTHTPPQDDGGKWSRGLRLPDPPAVAPVPAASTTSPANGHDSAS